MTHHKQTDRISIMLTQGFEAIVNGREVKNQLKRLERKLWPKKGTSR